MEDSKKRENSIAAFLAGINEMVRIWQRRFADQLNDRCKNLSSRALLALLIVFCSICSAYFLLLIINGF